MILVTTTNRVAEEIKVVATIKLSTLLKRTYDYNISFNTIF